MCHKRHTNLKETLLADCSNRVMEHVTSLPKGYKKPPKKTCGCTSTTKIDGKCIFEGLCQTENVIYKCTWKPTGNTYIGKTQDMIKKRINSGHINGLRAFWNRKKNPQIVRNQHFILIQPIIIPPNNPTIQ